MNRRAFISTAAGLATAAGLHANTRRLGAQPQAAGGDRPDPLLIVDTHQHLWDLEKFRLNWLDAADPILRKSYGTAEYLEATKGLNFVQSVYMEVDVVERQQAAEAAAVIELCKSDRHPTTAAVISGPCERSSFAAYFEPYAKCPYIKGVRRLLTGVPPDFALAAQFVDSVRLLGQLGKSFDLCVRPTDLAQALQLVKQCPDTRFVLDHCGNADVKAFAPATAAADRTHDPEQWKRDIDALAGQGNVIVKISGIVAQVPEGWDAELLAPVIQHCLDAFGPDRAVFGSDWPVCLLGAALGRWVDALKQVVADRPLETQRKLFQHNAVRFYGLDSP